MIFRDPNALDEMIERLLVDYLSDEIVARLRARLRRALVLFTDTGLGLDEALAALETLREQGTDMTAVITPEARMVLSAQSLQAVERTFDCADIGENFEAALAPFGRMIVPTLSTSVAAKVSCAIADCLGSRLLTQALERGIPIVAASDGCCPDTRTRRDGGFRGTDAFRGRLRANLVTLQSYGIRLVQARSLATVEASSKSTLPASPSEPHFPMFHPGAEIGPTGRKVFGRSDAVLCHGNEVRLARDVLVTPFAIDELRGRNIRLVRI